MGRTLDDWTPAEHFLREWLPDHRSTVLADLDLLLERGLEIAHADHHSDGSGVEVLAVPRPPTGREPAGRALVWLYVHTGGHHVRTIPLAQVVAVEVDEDERSTRLAIHLNPPSLDLRFRSHNQAQRGWLRDLADVLQLQLVKG